MEVMEVMKVDMKSLWIISGILLGFQFNAFYWRIARESKAPEHVVTWISPADIVNLVSMMVMLFGVFLAPIMGFAKTATVIKIFGLSIILFVGHIFAMAAHYELFNNKTPRAYNDDTKFYDYFPRQEKIVISIMVIIIVLYSCWVLGYVKMQIV